MKIINGQALAEKIKDKVAREIARSDDFICKGRRPNLAIILVGEREDSKLYVDIKEREAKKIGIDTHIYRCPKYISEEEIIKAIRCLNKDELIDAILVQLPLSDNFNTDKIIKTIDPSKDVDRFHPKNLAILLSTCDHGHVMPPVFKVVLEILKSINCHIKGKHICIIANSNIFGKSLAKVLECQQAKTEVVYANKENLKGKTVQADILITAVGKPGFIKKDMVKKNAIVIDIGITKKGKKVYGDVDFANVKSKVSYITPVPGGVGPMTVAMLFKNTLELYKRRCK